MPTSRSIQRTYLLLMVWEHAIARRVAAITAGAQILGGPAAPLIRRQFRRRTSALLAMAGTSPVTLGLIALVESFWESSD